MDEIDGYVFVYAVKLSKHVKVSSQKMRKGRSLELAGLAVPGIRSMIAIPVLKDGTLDIDNIVKYK